MRKVWLILSMVMFSLVSALSLAAEDDFLPEATFPAPVFVNLKTHNFKVQTLDRLQEQGFQGFRRGLYWGTVETEKGVYDFSKWQEPLDHAKERGLRAVCVFFGGNKLYEDDGLGGIQTEAGRQGFANFAAAAAENFRDHEIIWEIWNEPNVRTFWRKDGKHNSEPFAEEYTALVKEVARAVLAKDPEAFLVAGSVSNYWEPSYQWTEFCFQKGILETGIRGWSVHPYGVRRPEDFAEGHGITRKLLEQYGKPKFPMLNTERGFALGEHPGGGEVANEGWSGGPADQAQIYQAWHFVRQFMADQMHGLRLTVWYEWDGKKFGLLPGSPVETAARVMGEQLKGYHYVKRLPTESELDYVLLWEDGEGGRKLVVWTAPPSKATPDRAIRHAITLPGIQGPAKVVDLAGKESALEGDGPIRVEVGGDPQYITDPEK